MSRAHSDASLHPVALSGILPGYENYLQQIEVVPWPALGDRLAQLPVAYVRSGRVHEDKVEDA
eukprot:13422362-Alexandrium_andersonii.AAC.1